MESASLFAEPPSFTPAGNVREPLLVDEGPSPKARTISSFDEHNKGGAIYKCMLTYIAIMSTVILLGTFTNSALIAFDRTWAVDAPSSEMLPVCGCGHSILEAISNGCKFDTLASAWLPEACRNDELTAEFERNGPGPNGTWTWYAEKSGGAVLTLEDVAWRAAYDGDYWVTHGYQTMRCFMLWQRESEVWASGGQMENRALDHIKRCEHDMRICKPADEIVIHLTTHLNGDKN